VKRRTTEITIEIESVLELKLLVSRCMGQCNKCHKIVTLVTLQEAGKFANQFLNEISRLLEQERIHIIERTDGSPYVCLESLLGYIRQRSR
jgi:hypothetical protein